MSSAAPMRIERVHAGVLALLLAAAAGAWIATRQRMLGMDAGPGTDPGTVGFYTISWVGMMAAMMLPSIAPIALAFAAMPCRRPEAALWRVTSTGIFIAGYLVAWTAFGLVAYGLFDAARALSLDAFSWQRGGRYLAGAVLVGAAVYELTPAKDACLRRCRGPQGFLATRGREGARGALRRGALHGVWCVGCCWALMASLFALGVMSLTWMVVIGALIAIEKLLPSRVPATFSVAGVLVVLGLGVALVPAEVPALTLPGSQAATHSMREMGAGPGQTMR